MAIRLKKEYDLAFIYFTKNGMNAKDIAKKIGISENTLSGKNGWINKYNWKKIRNANYSTNKKTVEQLEELHAILVERRLEQEKEGKDADKALIFEIRTLSKEIEKYTKDKVSLTIYLDVVNEFMDALKKHDTEMYVTFATFVKNHIQEKVTK